MAPGTVVGPGRPFGSTGLVPSALGFGGAPIAGLYEPVSDDEAGGTVHRALELGLTYLDTAPHYGRGLSEERLGRALRDVRRESYLLSTKVGRLLRPVAAGETAPSEGFAESRPFRRVRDYSRAGIVGSLEESLGRLGLERVDVAFVHDPDDFEADVYATAFPALAELRARGLVGAVGVGMNQAEMLTRFVERLDLDVVLLAGRYSLLDQLALRTLLPACRAHGVSVIVGGALNGGLLADPRPGARYDYSAAPPALVDRAARIGDICNRHGVPLLAAALQFPLGHPAVSSVLVGARSAQEISDNATAFTTPVPDAVWADLRTAGLIGDGIPVPVGRA
jgi:D-threo-aldose 1-dehydrogenase